MTKPSLFDLRGKLAVVTGGSTGIGRGIAEGLAEAGCNLVICSRNLESCKRACEEIAGLGVQTLPLRCDVSKNDDVENLLRETTRRMGRIDILVNNAGTEGREISFWELSEDDWDQVLNTNLKGAFLCSRAVVREMIERGGGKIINVASIASFIGFQNVAAYCASKGGLMQLTRAMALDLARYNIQVNAVCPGFISTPMSQRLYDETTWEKIAKRHVPMGRRGRPEELKGAAIYLASSASDFMTGSCIVVDGGQHVW